MFVGCPGWCRGFIPRFQLLSIIESENLSMESENPNIDSEKSSIESEN